MGSDYWAGMIDWIKETMLGKEQNISPEDMDFMQIVDEPQAAVDIINEFYGNNKLKPNF